MVRKRSSGNGCEMVDRAVVDGASAIIASETRRHRSWSAAAEAIAILLLVTSRALRQWNDAPFSLSLRQLFGYCTFDPVADGVGDAGLVLLVHVVGTQHVHIVRGRRRA